MFDEVFDSALVTALEHYVLFFHEVGSELLVLGCFEKLVDLDVVDYVLIFGDEDDHADE